MRRFLLATFLSLYALSTQAADFDTQPLFAGESIIDLTLLGDFSRIDREKDKDAGYEGTMSVADDSGNLTNLKVTYSVRGNNRLQNCRYAPLWLDLDKDELEGTVFSGQNRLKLVVQCDNSNTHRTYLLREYLAYKLFRIIEPRGFAVRLVNVTYEEPGRDRARTQIAFLIEHQSRLSERIGLPEADVESISSTALDPVQAEIADHFMFMIGNTDYSLITSADDECCHNAKLFVSGSQYVPIPYDFDSSGLVDASYASPNASLPIRTNRQRLYRGYCRDRSILDTTVEHFQARKAAMLTEVENTPFLDERSRGRLANYIEDYFEIIGDESKLDREIIRDCR